ncbi:retrotransposon gag protein [Cucumis melo var. makuwa]|uniref:Retrotransposon gag protein n=1 Tax=Cucumis melo var. makuwa TaxID=1194695 RepID=A0A5D3C1D3_CUCMM|nr:retrotransposon gag protein [Cucumis melo var. makuwa]
MREENNILNLYNQQPLRGLEPSLDSPLDPNLGRGNMGEVREKNLRELVEPDEDQRPLCIIIPPTTQPFELKSGLIHLLPIFKGSFGEDPHKHHKDFYMVCDSMRLHGISKEQLNLRAFPFSLMDVAKRWLYYLEPGSITTWDAAAGGALADKTPIEARELISRMTEISQSFGNRASELDNSLTKVCGVCGLVGHPNDKCPEVISDVNIVQKYDPHGNTYNSGWRDNPNLRWGNDNQKHTQAPPTSSNQGTNLEDIIKALATNTLSFQQEMKQQMTQLTTAISKMDGKGKLTDQPNHANVSTISLRSGKILDTLTTKEKKVTSKPLPLNSKNESKEEKIETNPSPSKSKNDKPPLNDFTPYIPKPPFLLGWLQKRRKHPRRKNSWKCLEWCKSTCPFSMQSNKSRGMRSF